MTGISQSTSTPFILPILSDTDYEYEQIKAKLDEFDNVEAEVEDYEAEDYLVHFSLLRNSNLLG